MFSKVMLLVIGALVIGVAVAGFVFSQGVGFPTAPPVSGVYHTADQVVCSGCVTSTGIQDGSIGSADVNANQICTSAGGIGCPAGSVVPAGTYLFENVPIPLPSAGYVDIPNSNKGFSWSNLWLETIGMPQSFTPTQQIVGLSPSQVTGSSTAYRVIGRLDVDDLTNVGLIAGRVLDHHVFKLTSSSEIYLYSRLMPTISSTQIMIQPNPGNPNVLQIGTTNIVGSSGVINILIKRIT